MNSQIQNQKCNIVGGKKYSYTLKKGDIIDDTSFSKFLDPGVTVEEQNSISYVFLNIASSK